MNATKKETHFLAFDIGATSGRTVVGTLVDGRVELKPLTRFPNKIVRVHDRYYWDLFALYESLKEGLSAAAAQNMVPASIGIDTWGVDFVYLGADGALLSQPRSYRDPYTNGAPEAYFERMPRREVYARTGVQIMNFNTIYQLFAASEEQFSPLKAAHSLLFIPDALSYLLTGKRVCEYTIASTSQLLSPETKQWDEKLFEAMNLSSSLVSPPVAPGTVIGPLLENIAKECGLPPIPVMAVAGHDTASAVAAIPAEDEHFAYLSSGTWSLMGIEVKEPIMTGDAYRLNFTNEGGVEGTTRFLKNITGMWLLEQCRKEWEAAGDVYTYDEIVAMSESVADERFLIHPDDPSFANPESMTRALVDYCRKHHRPVPETRAEVVRCIFNSLALRYSEVLENLQQMAPFPIERLHVIGGGSQNRLLNQMTADAVGIPVIAGPSEATALGNVMMQARGLGIVGSLGEMREMIRRSVALEVFEPRMV
jgi:rhamnulokinase